jgi:hypothetical protein
MAEVFISYPRDARQRSLRLAVAIRAKGVDVWCAEDNLSPGADWKTRIITALEDADAVIFVILPGSQPSAWIQEEWMAALESYWAGKKKMLIPVFLGNADSPAFLMQWPSLRIKKPSDVNKVANQIVKWLHSEAKPQVEITKKIKQERSERIRELEAVARHHHELLRRVSAAPGVAAPARNAKTAKAKKGA